ncbi:hypothetical protein FACS1894158_17550 [Betaproteobacteria bacterium]|nr:hypothetical protein FACS1894158_17550 [Betaproteobacteria bacterium]
MPGDLPDILWLTDRSVYRPFGAELDRLDSLLSDEESHIWLESVVRFRLSENYALPSPGLTDPYHPRHLPAWQTPLRFIDCGAFDGDTLRHFTKNGYDFAAIAAFEPDMDNFQRLSETVRYYENVVCFPCAVGASTEIVRFNASSNTSSHISANSVEGTPVQCVRLDEALPTFAPNLIKMDIEGAELDALNGARGIITKYRPGLAICLYHIPEHLWQIPLLLHNWNLGYRFYIRGHCHNSFELVFYAIPEQQI